MTELQQLQTEADISQWVNWNMPNKIEEKLLELLTDFLNDVDLHKAYLELSRNPEMKSVQNSQITWNKKGTDELAKLALLALERVELDDVEK